MRRLPVYLLLDTSGSMKGEPIESVKAGLRAMVDSLRQDPQALESVWISVITFDRDVTTVVPLTAILDFQVPELATPDSGPTHMGRALQVLCQQVDAEIVRSTDDRKGDWRPILFLMTDGSPSDKMDYKAAIPEIQRRNFALVIACAAGSRAKTEELKLLTDQVFTLETMDSSSFESLFRWVSSSIEVSSTTMGATADLLPPPPPEDVNPVL